MEPVRIDVTTPSRRYVITLADGVLDRLTRLLDDARLPKRRFVVSSPLVWRFHGQRFTKAISAEPIIVPDGERFKQLATVSRVYDALIRANADRASTLLTFGGGVIGDLAGFAAATYLRGIALVHVPTTLLAQVDSAIGGKVGVNHALGKNLIGAFYQPKLVLIDTTVLRSLPRRELIAGLAEVIKYGIIADPALFSTLEQGIDKVMELNQEMLTRIVATSCAIKARVVEADEREDDYRAVLNFGHTIGHALEAATGYRQFLHGEAVGVGLVKATALSVRQGFCDGATLNRVTALVHRAGLPVDMPPAVSPQSLIQAMEIDKKVAGGKIKFIMCEGIGRTRFHWLPPEEILHGLAA